MNKTNNHGKNTVKPLVVRNYTLLTLLGSTALLAACGGGSDNKETVEADPIVATTSTNDLKASASRNFGASLNASLPSSSGGEASGTTADNSIAGAVSEVTETVSLRDEAVNEGTNNLFGSMLALDDDGSRTVRDGNRLTIDPDPVEVCEQDTLDMSTEQMEYERCLALVEDMTVIIDATSDTAGTVHYRFQDQRLASIGYSESSESIEVVLEGLKTLADAENALNPDSEGQTSLPTTFAGALLLSASAAENVDGLETNSSSLKVTQAVRITDADSGSDISMAAGTLFSMSVDEVAGTGELEIAVGAVTGHIVDEDNTASDLDLKGLTANIAGNTSNGALVVSNLGIGQGPLLIELNAERVLDLSLETFGFSVSTDEEQISIDGALDLSLFLNEAAGDNAPGVQAMGQLLELMAPAGTLLVPQQNGSVLVSGAGPLGFSFNGSDEDGNEYSTSLSVAAGQCVGSPEADSPDDDGTPQIVICD